jgi:hypothetical protein
MAYTAPTPRSLNDLITPSIWNTDLVDNIVYLKSELAKRTEILNILTVAANNASTTAETALWTYNLAGTKLGTASLIKVKGPGIFYNGSGSTRTFSLKFYYGAQSVEIFNSAFLSGKSYSYDFELYLSGNAATGSQKVSATIRWVSTETGSIVSLATTATITTDSNAANDLIIKAQNSASAANIYTRLDILTAEFYP